MKLLIVDDEAIERTAIRMVIERHLPDVEIVGEAENGRVALQMIEQLTPDIVTLDIKMPGMDGIQVIKAAENKEYPTKFIMLSAYDDFDYARQVMRYGVKEYLVKPCKPEQLISAIQHVSEDIRQQQYYMEQLQHLQQNKQETEQLMESELVSHIIMDEVLVINMEERRAFLKNRMVQGATTFVISLEHEDDFLEIKDKQRFYCQIRSIFKEHCVCMVGPMVGKHLTVFVFLQDESGYQRYSTRSYTLQLSRQILVRAERLCSSMLRIGVGSTVFHLQDLVKSYHEALLSLQHNLSQKITIYDDLKLVQKLDEELKQQNQAEQLLLHSIRKGDLSLCEELFDRYIKQVLKLAHYNVDLVRYELKKQFTLIEQIITDHGLELQLNVNLEMLESVFQITEHAKQQMNYIVAEIHQWLAVEHKGSLLRAKQYIAENFHKDLNLEEVASKVQLNPYYFSKLFHERNGVTFIDYITQLRIERAKVLLMNSHQSLKQISIEIGYRDPNYFSRVFKKVVGISPSEYRNKKLKSSS